MIRASSALRGLENPRRAPAPSRAEFLPARCSPDSPPCAVPPRPARSVFRRSAARARANVCRAGYSSTSSSAFTAPEISVPVTTVPNPFIAKERSIGSRKCRVASFAGTASARARSSFLQRVQTRAAPRAHRHHRRTFQKRSAHEFLDFQPHQSQYVGIHQIGFRNGDDSPRDSQQTANIEMLARLRLDRFVRRHYQQHQVDSAHPASMLRTNRSCPGTSTNPSRAPARSRNANPRSMRNSAAFFFFQAVGICAGQRLNQRGFSVVNVPGRADDDVFEGFHRKSEYQRR